MEGHYRSERLGEMRREMEKAWQRSKRTSKKRANEYRKELAAMGVVVRFESWEGSEDMMDTLRRTVVALHGSIMGSSSLYPTKVLRPEYARCVRKGVSLAEAVRRIGARSESGDWLMTRKPGWVLSEEFAKESLVFGRRYLSGGPHFGLETTEWRARHYETPEGFRPKAAA